MKILIADDSKEMRLLLTRICGGVAEQIITAADGQEALEAFGQYRPDWVLMDIAMPGMDGLEATARITKEFPGARVLILTQFDRPSFREAARQAGAAGYLLKDDLLRLPVVLSRRDSCGF